MCSLRHAAIWPQATHPSWLAINQSFQSAKALRNYFGMELDQRKSCTELRCETTSDRYIMSPTTLMGWNFDEEFITYLLTPSCRILFQKLFVALLVKKYPAFFVEPEGSSPCSKKPAIGPYPEPAESLRSSLMLSSHLRLCFPSGLLPSGLPTKIL